MTQLVRGTSDNLLEDIVRLLGELRKSDRRVADVVLERHEEVISKT